MTDDRNGVLDLVRHSGLGAIAEECHRLAKARGKYDGSSAEQPLKDLAEEVVELTVAHAVGLTTGVGRYVHEELGDVLANVLSFAVEVGVDPEQALRDAMERNRQRAEEGVSDGS